MLHKVSKSCLQFSQVFQKWPKFARIYHYFPKVTQGFQKLPKISKSRPRFPKIAQSCPKVAKNFKTCQKFPNIGATWLHLAELGSTRFQLVPTWLHWVSLLEVGYPSNCSEHTLFAKSCLRFSKVAQDFQKLPKVQKLRKIAKAVKGCQKMPKVAKNFQNLPKVTKHWCHLTPLGSTRFQLVPTWFHWVRLDQFAWGWLPIKLLRTHKATSVLDWLDWITEPPHH